MSKKKVTAAFVIVRKIGDEIYVQRHTDSGAIHCSAKLSEAERFSTFLDAKDVVEKLKLDTTIWTVEAREF